MQKAIGVCAAIIAMLTLWAQPGIAVAAEVKFLCAVIMRPAMEDIVRDFERDTGHKVSVDYATIGNLRDRIRNGEAVDLTILSRPMVEALANEGRLAAGSETVVARATVGVSVRVGAPRPDVSSAESFKRSLLAAKSVVYADPAQGGASGVHFARVLVQLGIAEEIKPKTILVPGAGAGEVVARGEAELGISGTPDLMRVPGADFVGPLPAELQNTSEFVYVAAIVAGARQPHAAQALIKHLVTQRAAGVIKAKGMDPG